MVGMMHSAGREEELHPERRRQMKCLDPRVPRQRLEGGALERRRALLLEADRIWEAEKVMETGASG